MRKSYCLFFCFLFSACGQNPGKTVEEKIDFVVKRSCDKGEFIGNVLVADQSKIIYQHGCGMADAKNNIALNNSTQFLIASVSKPFTAILILKLVQQGKLKLDNKIENYFKETTGMEIGNVTIHQLLTHTSGLKEGFNNHLNESDPFTPSDLLYAEFNFKPGTDFKYCNTGYVILKEIAVITSGTDFVKLMEEYIFTPLKMDSTGVARDLNKISNLAVGYKTINQQQIEEISYPMERNDGPGSLYSTALDLYKLDQALYSDTLLNKSTIDLMLTQHVKEKFGYGWFLRERGGIWDISFHQGNLPGYSAFLSRRRTNQQLIVILANATELNLSSLENKIAQILKKSRT